DDLGVHGRRLRYFSRHARRGASHRAPRQVLVLAPLAPALPPGPPAGARRLVPQRGGLQPARERSPLPATGAGLPEEPRPAPAGGRGALRGLAAGALRAGAPARALRLVRATGGAAPGAAPAPARDELRRGRCGGGGWRTA